MDNLANLVKRMLKSGGRMRHLKNWMRYEREQYKAIAPQLDSSQLGELQKTYQNTLQEYLEMLNANKEKVHIYELDNVGVEKTPLYPNLNIKEEKNNSLTKEILDPQ